ncbi:hypothetical protein FDP41_010778 [Naegleria fowleri]|uniref:Uncharacterized protein n=1 Tax=Naegleria fowleri TaxID=5763 RepID=A0A6A5CC03_NAEFO|nr:uncharacterized protein FDP41_010778 [Naegleria fowleri]KAF0982799.1 hypothetical protein FDP41_010778 [Naegleria fowleri]CAG4715201.1 unnamed protein product [Naegleria fowleri]
MKKRQQEEIIEILDDDKAFASSSGKAFCCSFVLSVKENKISSLFLDTSKAHVVKQKSITNYFNKQSSSKSSPLHEKKSKQIKQEKKYSQIIQAPSEKWFSDKISVLKVEDIQVVSSQSSLCANPSPPLFQKINTQLSSDMNIKNKKVTFQMNCSISSDSSICAHVSVPIKNKKSHPVVVTSTTGTKRQIPQFALSFLKSALQKTIRLGKAESSVRIASVMIYKFSFLEFLRRILVIIVEDAILHPMTSLMAWMMTYYSGKHFSSEESIAIPKLFVDACLQLVYDIANVKFRENLHQIEEFLNEDEVNSLFQNNLDALSPTESTLLRSLFIRSCFGGMTGDITLLNSQAYLWQLRFSKRVEIPSSIQELKFEHFKIPNIFQPLLTQQEFNSSSEWFKYLCAIYYHPDFNMCEKASPQREIFIQTFCNKPFSGELFFGDLLVSSIDFHCFPSLIEKCCIKYHQLEANNSGNSSTFTPTFTTATHHASHIRQQQQEYQISNEELSNCIKHIIWHKSSKLNIRNIISTTLNAPTSEKHHQEGLNSSLTTNSCSSSRTTSITINTSSTLNDDYIQWLELEWNHCLTRDENNIYQVLAPHLNPLHMKAFQAQCL